MPPLTLKNIWMATYLLCHQPSSENRKMDYQKHVFHLSKFNSETTPFEYPQFLIYSFIHPLFGFWRQVLSILPKVSWSSWFSRIIFLSATNFLNNKKEHYFILMGKKKCYEVISPVLGWEKKDIKPSCRELIIKYVWTLYIWYEIWYWYLLGL